MPADKNIYYFIGANISDPFYVPGWAGFQAGDFEAVVMGRVVRGRHLDAPARAQVVDGEINLRRVDHPDVDHVRPRRQDALDQRLRQ